MNKTSMAKAVLCATLLTSLSGCFPLVVGGVALGAAATADPTDRILVFGSFHTVGGVLKDGLPRLQARHLGL